MSKFSRKNALSVKTKKVRTGNSAKVTVKGVRNEKANTLYVRPTSIRIADKGLAAKFVYAVNDSTIVDGKDKLTLQNITPEVMAWAVANAGKQATVTAKVAKTGKEITRDNSLSGVGKKVKPNGAFTIDKTYRNNILKFAGIAEPKDDVTYEFAINPNPEVGVVSLQDRSNVISTTKNGTNRYGKKEFVVDAYILTLVGEGTDADVVEVENEVSTPIEGVVSVVSELNEKDAVPSFEPEEDEDFA